MTEAGLNTVDLSVLSTVCVFLFLVSSFWGVWGFWGEKRGGVVEVDGIEEEEEKGEIEEFE